MLLYIFSLACATSSGWFIFLLAQAGKSQAVWYSSFHLSFYIHFTFFKCQWFLIKGKKWMTTVVKKKKNCNTALYNFVWNISNRIVSLPSCDAVGPIIKHQRCRMEWVTCSSITSHWTALGAKEKWVYVAGGQSLGEQNKGEYMLLVEHALQKTYWFPCMNKQCPPCSSMSFMSSPILYSHPFL